jgi:hypothetical protein
MINGRGILGRCGPIRVTPDEGRQPVLPGTLSIASLKRLYCPFGCGTAITPACRSSRQIGGYRVLAVTSDRDTALQMLKSTSLPAEYLRPLRGQGSLIVTRRLSSSGLGWTVLRSVLVVADDCLGRRLACDYQEVAGNERGSGVASASRP